MNSRDEHPGMTPVAESARSRPTDPQRVYAFGAWEIDCARHELRVQGTAVPIGSRAFEILEALVRSPGELVTKEHLMASVWSNAIVEDNTLQVHISAIRKALGADRGMLRTVSGRGYRLLGSWSIRQGSTFAEPEAPGSRRTADRPFRTNVPIATSALIGREAAVQHLRDLLSAYRVVTLTGPGGIGKTVLAAEVARTLFPTLESDVLLVELMSLTDPDLVPTAVVTVLGLQLGGDEISPESAARAIGAKKLLLVLDNCEHVVDAAAAMAETLVHSCPHVTVLATSREVLRIEGEYVYHVAALEVPPPQETEPERVLGQSAVRLLVARIAAQRSGFALESGNLAAVSAICRHLDGIPLAIEFAAARSAALGVQQVAARLDDRFSLLTGGRRTALPRHQTLRAALDWSYELLPESERRLLRQLAIFPAAFTLEAATAVAGEAASAVADGVSSLVSKSLLTLDGSASRRRWRLIETIRAYAHEKLSASGELPTVAWRQARYYRTRLREIEAEWREGRSEDPAEIAEVIANTRGALDWAFSPAGDESKGVKLTVASVSLWLRSSGLGECRERAEIALGAIERVADLEPGSEMLLRAALGMSLMYTRGPVGEAEAVWTRVLDLAERIGHIGYQLRALYGLWLYRFLICEFRVALELSERFRSVAASGDSQADFPTADRMTAITLHFLGDQAAACAYADRALRASVLGNRNFRTIHYGTDQRVGPQVFLARALWLRGLPDQALRAIAAAVDEAVKVGHANSTCIALADGACLLSIFVDDADAAERFASLLTECAETHALGVWRTYALAVRGRLLLKRDAAEGAGHLRSALADLQKTPYDVRFQLYCAWLAETLAAAGRPAEALEAVGDALRRAERTDERWYFPELLRIRGNLLILEGGSHAVEAASDCFSQSLQWAQRQEALSWELRTIIDVARLRLGDMTPARARSQLQAVYDRFREGFGTGDLLRAGRLLAELAV
ncbi:MAG TPA: winged helix-turn-helix domain-containing protein [Stellaceae bacterium]|nr:winged helix-turn-helix domain-containing protein [Stellaceae bacterium]